MFNFFQKLKFLKFALIFVDQEMDQKIWGLFSDDNEIDVATAFVLLFNFVG